MARRASSPPSERVRAALAAVAGPDVARRMPAGYHRMGRVLLVRLPASLEPYHSIIGAAWQRELGVGTVLARAGPIEGEIREPRVTVIAGGTTETEVIEHGIRYRFDAARTMFATGNRTERQRIAGLVVPGESIADLFAGIGYFSVPIAARARPARLVAVEKNPVAHRYLLENLAPYRERTEIETRLGDNRTVDLPASGFDRILLGYLPTSRPWIPRALELARPVGAWVHLHEVADTRTPLPEVGAAIAALIERAGATIELAPRVREVKPYGPGRRHVVIDARVRTDR